MAVKIRLIAKCYDTEPGKYLEESTIHEAEVVIIGTLEEHEKSKWHL